MSTLKKTRVRTITLVSAVGLCLAAAVGATVYLGGTALAGEPASVEEQMDDYVRTEAAPAALQKVATVELGEFHEAYPAGVSTPTLADLIPWSVGADVVSADSTRIVLDSPAENPSTMSALREAGVTGSVANDGVTVITSAGDIAVLAATHWQCAWMQEWQRAVDRGDDAARNAALAQLERYSSLDVITKYNPEDGRAFDSGMLREIRAGNSEPVRSWLATTCKALLAK